MSSEGKVTVCTCCFMCNTTGAVATKVKGRKGEWKVHKPKCEAALIAFLDRVAPLEANPPAPSA